MVLAAQSKSPPQGIKPKTLRVYTTEWLKYCGFASRRGHQSIPGRDVPWDMSLLWQYLQFRSSTCKPSTQKGILSALAHFGSNHGQLLATSRFDYDSLAYRNICKMKKQLLLDFRVMHNNDETMIGPNRCTPLARQAVSMMFNAFGVVDFESFASLHRADRHHLFVNAISHTAGMRFGHFPARSYVKDMFVRDPSDGSYRLTTDWHRFEGARRFCLVFAAVPAHRSMWYDLRSSNGTVVDTISAATVIAWHFRLLDRDGEQTAFAPDPDTVTTGRQRVAWLKRVMLSALPLDAHRAREMVDDVTPHSFRPGLAGDLLREGVSLQLIALICRWSDIRNVRTYGDRMPLSVARSSTAFRVIDRATWLN